MMEWRANFSRKISLQLFLLLRAPLLLHCD